MNIRYSEVRSFRSRCARFTRNAITIPAEGSDAYLETIIRVDFIDG